MSGRPWTQEELYALEELIAQGVSIAAIARRFGRTENAVHIIRKRRGIRSHSDALLSARGVARLLGCDSKAVAQWCRNGWISARRPIARGGGRMWAFQEDALLSFLANPAYWMVWHPERITDAALREWALETRAFRWLTPEEVARRYFVTADAVRVWVDGGRLPGVIVNSHYWVAEPDLDGFSPPCENAVRRDHVRRFAASEDARLMAMSATGMTYTAMAAALGRTVGTVHQRVRLLRARRTEVAA